MYKTCVQHDNLASESSSIAKSLQCVLTKSAVRFDAVRFDESGDIETQNVETAQCLHTSFIKNQLFDETEQLQFYSNFVAILLVEGIKCHQLDNTHRIGNFMYCTKHVCNMIILRRKAAQSPKVCSAF